MSPEIEMNPENIGCMLDISALMDMHKAEFTYFIENWESRDLGNARNKLLQVVSALRQFRMDEDALTVMESLVEELVEIRDKFRDKQNRLNEGVDGG